MPAGAQDRGKAADPKRAVAVLEFRGGSAAMPFIGSRAADLLDDKTSLQVVGIDEARKRFGDSLDRQVAECGVDQACVSRLGKRLRVDEVLLVGVSEFGDVIVTLQRFDVKRNGQVVGRIAEAVAPDTELGEETLLGYLSRVMPETDFVRYGTIRIDANVDNATVKVDEEKRGVTPIDPLRVRAPATYRIDVQKPGYIGFEASVEVPPDAVVRVRPRLAERSDGLLSDWRFWSGAGAAVVGTVVLVLLLTRSDAEPDDPDIVIPPFE